MVLVLTSREAIENAEKMGYVAFLGTIKCPACNREAFHYKELTVHYFVIYCPHCGYYKSWPDPQFDP